MINDSTILLTKSSFANFLQWNNCNIFNLTNEIKASKQFCFWKYGFENSLSKKPLKIPYGYCEKKKTLICFLKDNNYWLSFDKVVELQGCFTKDLQLGLVLTNGSFSVIDIDNYQHYEPLDILLFNMLKKGAYIDLSPSGKGLQVFYQWTWKHERNKSVNAIIIGKIQTTCEVYSGKDVRFLTLTGQKLINKNRKDSLPMATASDLLNELSSLKEIFFNVDISTDLCDESRKNYLEQQSKENSNKFDIQKLTQLYNSIRNIILY